MEKKEIRACAIGTEQVINAWRAMNDDYPYFAVFYGIKTKKFFQYNRDSLQGAEDYLRLNLTALEDQGDNSQYYLAIYPESKVNYTGSGEIACFPFRLNPWDATVSSNQIGAYGGSLDGFAKMLQDSQAKHIELVKEIAELKAASQPMDWFEKIGAILETPGAAQTIVPLVQPVIGAIMGLVSKISGIPVQQSYPMYNNPVIAGPGESQASLDEKLDQALDRLEKHGDLVEMLTVLANFADKNPAMFKMYFDGLKAQQ